MIAMHCFSTSLQMRIRLRVAHVRQLREDLLDHVLQRHEVRACKEPVHRQSVQKLHVRRRPLQLLSEARRRDEHADRRRQIDAPQDREHQLHLVRVQLLPQTLQRRLHPVPVVDLLDGVTALQVTRVVHQRADLASPLRLQRHQVLPKRLRWLLLPAKLARRQETACSTALVRRLHQVRGEGEVHLRNVEVLLVLDERHIEVGNVLHERLAVLSLFLASEGSQQRVQRGLQAGTNNRNGIDCILSFHRLVWFS